MEIFVECLSLMDDTIIALLGVPVFAILLTGSLILALVGTFFMLKEAAVGRQRKK